MLTENQQKSLQLAIIEYLVGQGGNLIGLVGVELAGQAKMNCTNNEAARFVIDRCVLNGHVLTKVLKAIDRFKKNIDLAVIWKVAKEWQPLPLTDAFCTLELIDGPFVDRDSLRQCLRQLCENRAEPILLVNGELGMGKSYSAQMIVEEARRLTDFQISRLTANPDSASIWEIEHVALEIVKGLSTQTRRPLPHPVRGDRFAGLFADWTADEIARSGDTLWILFDGFNNPDILPETRKYIDEIITMIGIDQRLKRTRIVLFDFDLSRLDSLTRRYFSLALHLPSKDEIFDHFKALYPDFPEYYWESAATVTLENIPSKGPACMEKIQLNVRKATNVFKQ